MVDTRITSPSGTSPSFISNNKAAVQPVSPVQRLLEPHSGFCMHPFR